MKTKFIETLVSVVFDVGVVVTARFEGEAQDEYGNEFSDGASYANGADIAIRFRKGDEFVVS